MVMSIFLTGKPKSNSKRNYLFFSSRFILASAASKNNFNIHETKTGLLNNILPATEQLINKEVIRIPRVRIISPAGGNTKTLFFRLTQLIVNHSSLKSKMS